MRYWLSLFLLLSFFSSAKAAAPSCWPKPVGKGSALVVKADTAGMSYGWLCGSTIVQVWGRWSDFLPDWHAIAAGLAAGTDAERAAAWDKYTVLPARDAKGAALYPSELGGVVPPVWSQLFAMLPTYVVAKAASNANPPGTLPVYRWDGVKLGSAITGLRANEGTPCDCTTKITTTATYCLIPSLQRSDAMSRCVAR